MKTFTIGGSSKGPDGVVKWRFANGSAAARAKVLEDHGHSEIKFLDLPRAMTKEEGTAWLSKQDLALAPVTKGSTVVWRAVQDPHVVTAEQCVEIAHEQLGFAASGRSWNYWLTLPVGVRQERSRNAARAVGYTCGPGTYPELEAWLWQHERIRVLEDGTLEEVARSGTLGMVKRAA